MLRQYKITFLCLTNLLCSVLCMYGQQHLTSGHHKTKTPIVVGFRSGSEKLFTSRTAPKGKEINSHPLQTNKFFARTTINNHLAVEAGFGLSKNFFHESKPNLCCDKLLVPVTLQYHFLSGKYRLRPFFGAGLQYNQNLGNNSFTPSRFDEHTTTTDQGTKYVTILFTQGMTYEVSTKIQVTQSFHFIPVGTDKTLGIDIGVGFTIP